MSFLGGSDGKEFTCNVGDLGQYKSYEPAKNVQLVKNLPAVQET